MSIAAIYLQLAINITTEAIVWNHSSDGAFNQQFRVATATCPDTFRFVSANVTGKAHIRFLFFFFSRDPHFFRIDNNDKIPGIDVGRENSLLFPAQQVGGLHSDAAEYLVLSVYDPPLARHFGGFCGKGFHVWKKEHESYGCSSPMSTCRRSFGSATFALVDAGQKHLLAADTAALQLYLV